MHSDLRAQEAFRLTGLRADAGVATRFRPALAARLQDLRALRYDFPVVLLAKGEELSLPLTAIIDRLSPAAADGDARRDRDNLLRLEREIRRDVACGASGTLTQLWDAAAQRLAPRAPKSFAQAAAAARKALEADGEVIDCDARFPRRFVAHAWRRLEARKAGRLREELDALVFRLRQLLAADAARSPQGLTAAKLRETVGQPDRESFDFEAMAGLIARTSPRPPLPEARRRRLAALIATLESARPYTGEDCEEYAFERCASALRAFRSRYDGLRAFWRALAMARLEADGAYDDALHAPLFRQLAENPLTAGDLERLPTYLVTLRWEEMDAPARADLDELLCSGMPVRILVQTDDLLAEATTRAGLGAIGSHAHALAGSAMGLDDVFVLQAPASSLPAMRGALARALACRGTVLLSVFSGASGEAAALPPYLNAAAALESRVFPALTFDPAAEGEESALSLAFNPQPEAEWPLHELEYEDAQLQRGRRKVAFTPADFVAADARFATHFLAVGSAPREEQGGTATVLVVDEQDRLRELLVDDAVAFQSRRCAHRWRHLQRLASGPVAKAAPAAAPAEPPPAAEPPGPAPAAAPGAAPAPASDEAYIETPRCTTCNECTQINNRMFAYDANKQAFIADLRAGTYRQLVEAAESCQVSIIHPGKPFDPGEAGLEELIERAAPFR